MLFTSTTRPGMGSGANSGERLELFSSVSVGGEYVVVPGDGPKGGGMIVGEAPGFKEEEVGLPFVGPSGRLLDVALASLGIRRAEVYITNMVKMVPLNSEGKIRKPNSTEIQAWRSLLAREIVEIAPVAILCLGRVAVDELVEPGFKFGQNDEYHYAAWHPSFLLHGANGNENAREEWLEQLRPWSEALGKYEYAS